MGIAMKNMALKNIILFTGISLLVSCNADKKEQPDM